MKWAFSRFGGRPILFSDSAAKLKKQLELGDEALKIFNAIASVTQFRELKK